MSYRKHLAKVNVFLSNINHVFLSNINSVFFSNINNIFFLVILIMYFCSSTARHGLKDQKKMEELQMKIIDCLRDHCTYNSEAQKKPHLFSYILSTEADLRTLSREGLQRMIFFKDIFQAPPIIEDMFLSNVLPF